MELKRLIFVEVLWSKRINLPSKTFWIKVIKVPGESLGGLAVWHLPLAQGAILESWDQVPHRAPSWSLLLPLPVSLPPLSLSLSLSLMNK